MHYMLDPVAPCHGPDDVALVHVNPVVVYITLVAALITHPVINVLYLWRLRLRVLSLPESRRMHVRARANCLEIGSFQPPLHQCVAHHLRARSHWTKPGCAWRRLPLLMNGI